MQNVKVPTIKVFLRTAATYRPRTQYRAAGAVAAAQQSGETSPPGYTTTWTVYKTRGAVGFKPIPPQWKLSPGGLRVLEREGTLLCEFANSSGQRQYDWQAKQTFALSAAELGELLSFVSHEATGETSVGFFHDPNKGSQSEGQIVKKLAISPATNGQDYYLNLNVTEKPKPAVQMNVTLTRVEMRVLRSLAEYCIPRFLGFDKILEHEPRIMP